MKKQPNIKKLIKRQFIGKIVYQRLQWKHDINDVSWEDIEKLIKSFFRMLAERDLEKEFFLYNPISYRSFKTLSKIFIDYMKEDDVISKDIKEEDIDMDYIEAIVESLIYGERMFLYCTLFAGDRIIIEMYNMPRSIRNAFATIHFTKLLDLALIYANTNDSKNLDGIGPKKYEEFQRYMSTGCEEFEVYEKEAQGV